MTANGFEDRRVGPTHACIAASVAVAVPPLVMFAATVFVLAAALVGVHPLWPETPMNLAEAAALKDPADVIRLIQKGRNPDERLPVRPRVLLSETVTLTPLEAAIGARRLEVVEVLLKHGATLDEARRAELICLAMREKADDIVEFLKRQAGGVGDRPRCESVKLPW